jgi:hypothetical protein
MPFGFPSESAFAFAGIRKMRTHFTDCSRRLRVSNSKRPVKPSRKMRSCGQSNAWQARMPRRRSAGRLSNSVFSRASRFSFAVSSSGPDRFGSAPGSVTLRNGVSGKEIPMAASLERCHKCGSWVRVRKFQQGPTFNLIGPPRGPRMRCGWGCGAKLTTRNMRAHFTICAKRPAGSDKVDRRGRSLKAKRKPRRDRECCATGGAVSSSQRAGCGRIARYVRSGPQPHDEEIVQFRETKPPHR